MSSFPEELHRKCIAHRRPHPSASSETGGPAPDGEELNGDREPRDEDLDTRETHDEGKVESREKQPQKRILFPVKTADEKWEEGLDSKLSPLLGEVDVVDYGGRDIDE